MSYSFKWSGQATDFIPENLVVTGKPGRVAAKVKDMLYEFAQSVGEQDVQAHVRLVANGWEEKEPGFGQCNIIMEILPPPSAIESALADQQPVDLSVAAVPSSPAAAISGDHQAGGS